MQTINLLDPERSSIKYKLFTFSDGEPHIVLEEFDRKEEVDVICRVSNPTDLFILLQIGDILNRQGVEFTLDIRYLMGARMDRVMSFNEAFSLKIVAESINSIHPKKVSLYEVHSTRALALIHNSENTLYNPWASDSTVICLPDAGAKGRYEKFYRSYSKIICSKKRDLTTGTLEGFRIEDYILKNGKQPIPLEEIKDILVVDDLCDRGGTFVGIRELLKESCPKAKVSIMVTHMVSSIGIDNLCANYDQVVFTDSYIDWEAIRKLPENCNIVHL